MKGSWWTPPGSFRDLIALAMTLGFIAGFLVTGRISGEQFVQVFMAVLGIYGVMRTNDKMRDEDRPPPPREPAESRPAGEGRGKG